MRGDAIGARWDNGIVRMPEGFKKSFAALMDAEWFRLDLPEPELGQTRVGACVLYVDSFGNIALNLTREQAAGVGIAPGTQLELELGGERVYAVAARTFADARPGDIILYEDSYRNMSVAISGGNAAEMLHARAGQSLRINVGR